MVQQNVRFDATLGPAKLGPGKQFQAQRDGGRIQRQQLVLETELLLALPQPFRITEPLERRKKQILIQLGRAVFIGIGESGFIRRLADAEMNQFAQATAQAVADLAQGVGVGQLAEQHRDQLGPAAKAFGAPFGVVFLDQRSELSSGKMLEQLIE